MSSTWHPLHGYKSASSKLSETHRHFLYLIISSTTLVFLSVYKCWQGFELVLFAWRYSNVFQLPFTIKPCHLLFKQITLSFRSPRLVLSDHRQFPLFSPHVCILENSLSLRNFYLTGIKAYSHLKTNSEICKGKQGEIIYDTYQDWADNSSPIWLILGLWSLWANLRNCATHSLLSHSPTNIMSAFGHSHTSY